MTYSKQLATLILSLFVTSILFAQDKKGDDVVTNLATITALTPGFSYEAKVGKTQTLRASAFMDVLAVSVPSEQSFYDDKIKYYFDPALMLEYRMYYNYERRKAKHKRTDKNSMNYFAGELETLFTKAPLYGANLESADRRALFAAGILYGLQRNYSSRFSLDINFGIGVLWGKESKLVYDPPTNNLKMISVNETRFQLPGHITLGIWLGKK